VDDQRGSGFLYLRPDSDTPSPSCNGPPDPDFNGTRLREGVRVAMLRPGLSAVAIWLSTRSTVVKLSIGQWLGSLKSQLA
jgi:hypothetical protein